MAGGLKKWLFEDSVKQYLKKKSKNRCWLYNITGNYTVSGL